MRSRAGRASGEGGPDRHPNFVGNALHLHRIFPVVRLSGRSALLLLRSRSPSSRDADLYLRRERLVPTMTPISCEKHHEIDDDL